MVKPLLKERHQLMPGDMAERPSPGEREIFNKPVYTGHLERAEGLMDAIGVTGESKEGA